MATFSPNTFADTLNGLFKDTYADKLNNLIPDGLPLQKMIPFLPKQKQPGNIFHQPVILGHEHGITFAGPNEDAFTLLPAIAGQIKDATIQGNPALLRSVMGVNAASRAMQGGAQAFESATKYLVSNMMRSMHKKLEIEMFYGQMGYGVVLTAGTGTSDTGAVVGTNQFAIKVAEFAAGIWVGGENMPLEIRDSTGAISRGECTITAVNLNDRIITVNLLPAGVVVGDVIWHKGAYGNEFVGLQKIISNASGNIFGINSSAYSLWSGNVYSAASAALSFSKIERAMTLPVQKGLDAAATLFINPKTWADLLSEQMTGRRLDSSYNKAEIVNGAQALRMYGQNGALTIRPTIYCKEGYAFGISEDDFSRVGSTDVTFERPAMEGKFFKELENAAGYQLSCYADMALFCQAPGKQVLINNIVNMP